MSPLPQLFARSLCCIFLLLVEKYDATAESSTDRVLTVSTRFGDVIVSKDAADQCGCSGWIQFGSNSIRVGSSELLFASNEGVFPMKEGDVVLISIPAGVRNIPDQYYAILVDKNRFVDLTSGNREFQTEDWTFKVRQKGNELLFDLGFKNGKRKMAVYRNGMLTVSAAAVGTPSAVPKDRCAVILNNVVECGKFNRGMQPRNCSQKSIDIYKAIESEVVADSNLPIFKQENFYAVCASICETGKYDLRSARKLLCGY
jgi:hypothetical protein